MYSMPVAPEALLMTFSLKQVADMVIAFEDATMGVDSRHVESSETSEPATVRAPANAA